jgi:hypothetical protein
MITDEQHHWVEQLLDEGLLSQRRIAEITGVARGTVLSIAKGRRRQRYYFNPNDEPPPAEPPARCPGCGGLVYLPCQLCRLRHWQQRRTRRRRRSGRRASRIKTCRAAKRCGDAPSPNRN